MDLADTENLMLLTLVKLTKLGMSQYLCMVFYKETEMAALSEFYGRQATQALKNYLPVFEYVIIHGPKPVQ